MIEHSETESESEVDLQDSHVPSYSPDSVSCEDALTFRELGGVKEAVDTLKRINICDVPQGQNLYSDILKASNTIIGFLNDPFLSQGTDLDEGNIHKCLSTFTELVDIPFLSTLFEYRTVFHTIGAQAYVPGTLSSSTIVCWVDVVFATLGEAAVKIATGIYQKTDSSQQPMLKSLSRQRKEDIVRAAAQLPPSWRSIPGVISSDNASPAAKRLALRLTFAAYVMGPQFVNSDPWNDGGVSPSEMITTLSARMTQISGAGLLERPSTDHFNEQERISYAMIVSLFAASASTQRKIGDAEPPSPFRPRSLNLLIQLIQLVMHIDDIPSESLISPCEDLDIAQVIMIRWGETVPWCWTVWDDQRTVNAECVTALTTTWLHHIGVSLFGTGSSDPEAWRTELAPLLVKYKSAACSSILVLYQSMLVLCPSSLPDRLPPPSIDIITKACWAIVQLLDSTILTDRNAPGFSLELCKCLCSLFVLLGDSDDQVRIKSFLIEALCLIDVETIRLGVQGVQEDTKIYFSNNLDEAIGNSRRMMLDKTGQFSTKQKDFQAGKLLLDFLTVLWHSNARGYLYPHTISSLLFTLVDRLSQEPPNSLPSRSLRDSLITTLATLEVLRTSPVFSGINKVWQDETLWQLAIKSGCSDLVAASAFSRYVLATNPLCDPLNCAEAWDYLRDVLLLIFSGHFIGEDEPLALIVCTVVCQALLHLVREVGWQASRFIMCSPWTMSLCADLKRVLGDGSEQQTQYSLLLKDRLNSAGQALLDQINHKLHPTAAGPRMKIPNVEFRPLFCRLSPVPRLLLVPL